VIHPVKMEVHQVSDLYPCSLLLLFASQPSSNSYSPPDLPSTVAPIATMDDLPSYSSLFPDSDIIITQHNRGRQTRLTTITLREIVFPAGCPCHPAQPYAIRRPPTPPYRDFYVPRGRPTVIERAGSVSGESTLSEAGSGSGSSNSSESSRRPSWFSRMRSSHAR
jgi:hypothetical protein